MTKSQFINTLLTLALFSSPAVAKSPAALPRLHADPARVSVSGLSSGGFMAVQYDVAFSSEVMGVGVVAGGPYNCAFVNAGGIETCLQGLPVGAASYAAATGFAVLGEIDAPSNLAAGKVYLFSGTDDAVVRQPVMNAVRDFYTAAGVPEGNLTYVNDVPAGHAFLSSVFGGSCSTTGAPFVNQCTIGGTLYDQPGAILAWLYGTLQPRSASPAATPVAFDQTAYAGIVAGMAATGYVYIPPACKTSGGRGCAVHVVFHGCQQGAGEVKDAVYGRTGYNEWADSNKLILLYPQIDPTTFPVNPQGCWDWWGFTGLNFQTRWGAQLAAVHAMVARLTGQ